MSEYERWRPPTGNVIATETVLKYSFEARRPQESEVTDAIVGVNFGRHGRICPNNIIGTTPQDRPNNDSSR